MADINTLINELRKALPILKEKSEMGLIKSDSYSAADSMIRWHDAGRSPLSDRQVMYVSKLLERARRKHRRVEFVGAPAGSARPVDTSAIAAQVIEKIGDQRVSVEQVIESIMPKVLAAVEARSPRRVEITVTKYDGKVHKVKGPTHRNFDKLLRMATARLQDGYAPGIFLAGEASSGKSTAGRQLANALGLKFYFNGAITFAHEMIGFVDGAGKYHTTPFRQCYEFGGVYVFDEVDRSDPNALLAVNPHLANGWATFPDNPEPIKRHPNCIIICTANTWGLGADANYSGATKLDAAFLSRFPARLPWDIDLDLEAAIVPNADWLSRVRKARERARSAGLKVLIDVRVAQAGAALIEQGFSIDEAAEMTFLANLKPDQRRQIEAY